MSRTKKKRCRDGVICAVFVCPVSTPSCCGFWHCHPYIPVHFWKMFYLLVCIVLRECCCHGDVGPNRYFFTLSSMIILTTLMRGGREGGREGGRTERGREEKKGNEKEQEHKGIHMERYLSHLEDRGVREGEVEGEPPGLLCKEKGEGT